MKIIKHSERIVDEFNNVDYTDAIGECDVCKTDVHLFQDEITIVCPLCLAHYNVFGQRLNKQFIPEGADE
jgi:hypothetical protein